MVRPLGSGRLREQEEKEETAINLLNSLLRPPRLESVSLFESLVGLELEVFYHVSKFIKKRYYVELLSRTYVDETWDRLLSKKDPKRNEMIDFWDELEDKRRYLRYDL